MIERLLHDLRAQSLDAGVTLFADTALLPNIRVRLLWQFLYNEILKRYLSSETSTIIKYSNTELARQAGLERSHTIPKCLKQLKKLKLIEECADGIQVNFALYCVIIDHYTHLPAIERALFEHNFHQFGVQAYLAPNSLKLSPNEIESTK